MIEFDDTDRIVLLEYNDDLNTGSWQQLNGRDYLAVGPSLTVTDNLSGHAQRFYRIVQLD